MYLKSILAMGVLCAVSDTLMPEGPVKRVGKLVCGMVLLCTVLSPVVELDLTGANEWLEEYFLGIDMEKMTLEEQVGSCTKDIIEGKCAAYILDKAAQHGITCRVKVTCKAGEEGVWLPWAVEFLEPTSESGRNILARIAEEDLGIPPQRQSFVDEEAAA